MTAEPRGTETPHDLIASHLVIETDGWAAELAARVTDSLNAAASTDFETSVLFIREATAFTLPGRHVYVSRELLSRGLGEDGVAFVVAHEIGHHLLGHLDAKRAHGPLRSTFANLARSPQQVLDADRVAIDLCLAAGYAEQGVFEALRLLSRVALDAHHVEHVLGEAVPESPWIDRLLGVAATHPPLETRRAAAQAWLDAEHASPVRGTFDTWTASTLPSTGLFFACAACRLRFAARALCPRCGEQPTDLRDARARGALVRQLYRRAWAHRTVSVRREVAHAAGHFALFALAGVVAWAIAWVLDAKGDAAWIGVAAAALVATTAGIRLAAQRAIGRDLTAVAAAVDEHVQLEVMSGHPEATARVVSVTGRVHVLEPVAAVISRQSCAGYVIEGSGPAGPLADAVLGRFEVRSYDGDDALVAVDEALLDLPAGRAEREMPLSPPLEDFLRARGLVPDRRTWSLAETRLSEGNLVEVRGVAHARSVPDGRRGSRTIWVFDAWPTVRRLSGASVLTEERDAG